MKLATLKDGSRDGQLVVVSRDLSLAHHASGIATRMQQLLDDWNFLSPQLEDLYATLNGGKARHAFPFEPRQCMAPLPRAFARLDAAAGGPVASQRPAHAPSDALLGPCDDAVFAEPAWCPAVEPGLAVICGEIACAASPPQALDGVRLLMLAGAWALHAAPADAGGTVHERAAAAFCPVAVTPDELGVAWQGGRLRVTIELRRGGAQGVRLDAGSAMTRHFGELLAQAARTRALRAGTIVVAAPLGLPGSGGADSGSAAPGLQPGDPVRIEARDAQGESVFGAIEQTLRIAPA